MAKVLVLGAGGMVGHVVALHFRERGHLVTGAARRDLAFCPTLLLDAMNRKEVEKAVAGAGYDAVVNCLGILNRAVDARPHDGIWLNACLPHLLAELARDSGARVLHLSTDCVFSGHGAGGYREGDFRDADAFYGRSKALGELDDGRNLTFRTSIVGPDLKPEGGGLFNWFMRQEGAVQGYSGVLWTGVTTPVLARALEAALEQGLTGVYHLVNREKISKRELLGLFNQLRSRPVTLVETGEPLVDKSLVDTRGDFSFAVPTYAEMVMEMREWLRRHGDLYKHYRIRD